ncbi:MAG: sigma-70 family RNA polymerase sigma factor [Planctomycetes bacterium]|nr:sigma-70 family RNA polymerase sigma factor [Planctomycetota bacterium]
MEGHETQLGEWAGQVEQFLCSKLSDRELCRDLAQEAAYRLLQTASQGRRIADPRAWLFRAARNLAVDAVRRRLPSPLGLEILGGLPDPRSFPDSPSEPSWDLAGHAMSRSELIELLPSAIEHLPDHYRRAISCCYQDGLACEAMADREAISGHNAKIRLFRARRRLRELLVLEVRRNPEPLQGKGE